MNTPISIYPSHDLHYSYLVSYQKWLSQQSLAPNTLRVYSSRIKQFLLFVEYSNQDHESMGDLNQLKESMSLYLDFLKRSKGTRSLNANINSLNSFSHFLGIQGTSLKRERNYDKESRVLSLDEQQKFLKAVERQTLRDQALSLVLFHTGLRIGDCARLDIEDVVLNNLPFICLKNGMTVPLNKDTALALKKWLAERENTSDHALWITERGQRLTISGISFVIKRISWQAGLTVCTETLRRTAIFNNTALLNKKDLSLKFGSYLSPATLNRFN